MLKKLFSIFLISLLYAFIGVANACYNCEGSNGGCSFARTGSGQNGGCNSSCDGNSCWCIAIGENCGWGGCPNGGGILTPRDCIGSGASGVLLDKAKRVGPVLFASNEPLTHSMGINVEASDAHIPFQIKGNEANVTHPESAVFFVSNEFISKLINTDRALAHFVAMLEGNPRALTRSMTGTNYLSIPAGTDNSLLDTIRKGKLFSGKLGAIPTRFVYRTTSKIDRSIDLEVAVSEVNGITEKNHRRYKLNFGAPSMSGVAGAVELNFSEPSVVQESYSKD